MRNRILAAGCAAIVLSANAAIAGATYYVSNSGNDAWAGTITKPWRTIDWVNQQSFDPGVTILFEADGVWFGETGHLVISDSGDFQVSGGPITVGMYGSGERPIIGYDADVTGSTWTQVSGTDV